MSKKGKGGKKGGKCRFAIMSGVLLLACASGGLARAQCPGGVCPTYPSYPTFAPSCVGGSCYGYAPGYGYTPYRPTFGPAVQRPAPIYVSPYSRPAPILIAPMGPYLRVR